jgi:hypothetical protein
MTQREDYCGQIGTPRKDETSAFKPFGLDSLSTCQNA